MSIPISKYPYTDLHEMNMDWVIDQVKQLIEAWAETKGEWDDTKIAWSQTQEAWTDLYNYVHDYFDNLDVQQEINNKIDAMILDGTLQQMISDVITGLAVDAAPTQNSANLVTSGGVWQAIKDVTDQIGSVSHINGSVEANSSYTISLLSLPIRNYVLATTGVEASLTFSVGASSSGGGQNRHKVQTIITSSQVTVAKDPGSLGIIITNNSSASIGFDLLGF